MRNKGQEEIVGFVMVVVIVSVIAVILLGIFIRQGGSQSVSESQDVAAFLDSALQYTTNCTVRSDNSYASLGDLIGYCHDRRNCLSGEKACEVAESELGKMLNASWRVENGSVVKGYAFNATYIRNSTIIETEKVIFISSGECLGSIKGSEEISLAYPGRIISSFKICY